MKKCFKCEEEKELSEFYKHPANTDGHFNKCKECTKKDVKENRKNKKEYYDNYDRNRPNAKERKDKFVSYRKKRYASDPSYREKNLAWSWEDRRKNPEKYAARDAMTVAIKNGAIVRSETCEHCGDFGVRIEGHHWSYLPEHQLDITWLCTECHGKEHKRLNELGRDPDKQAEGELNENSTTH